MAKNLHILTQMDVRKVRLKNWWKLVKLEPNKIIYILIENVCKSALINSHTPSELILRSMLNLMHFIELRLQGSDKLVSIIEERALIKELEINSWISCDTNIEEGIEHFPMTAKKDLPEEDQNVCYLVPIIDKEAHSSVDSPNLLLQHGV